MSEDVWGVRGADDDPVGRLVETLGLTFDRRAGWDGWEPVVRGRVMTEAKRPGADGTVWAAAALRLLGDGAGPASTGDVATWRRVAMGLDRVAWFAAAGADANAHYDAVIEQVLTDHACTGLRPTMAEVLGRIAALSAPVVVAGLLEFAAGFYDNPDSEGLAPAFVAIVDAQAATRLQRAAPAR